MQSFPEQIHAEKFRPFFWVDHDFRICGWPDATARALRIPARAAFGRYCWDIILGKHSASYHACAGHCLPGGDEAAAASHDLTPRTCARPRCAVLPLPDPSRGAIVWLPFSQIATGACGSARLEGLVIRGALSERLGSIKDTLDSLRRICAADDCEMFLLDPISREVVLVDCVGQDREAFLERTHMPLGAGYPGTVTLQQKPLYTNRFQKDRVFLRNGVKESGIRSFIGVPLLEGDQPLGYVGLGWRDDRVPMEWGLRVLEEVRQLIPIAVPKRETIRSACAPAALGRIDIRCFGPLEIQRDGMPIPPSAFKRSKAPKLLRHLLLARGAPIHRDRLLDLLWPDSAYEHGLNRLHGVVNALRSALESGRAPRCSAFVLCRDDYFWFNVQAAASIDLNAFCEAEAVARNALSRREPERALEFLDQAVQLYRGDLFADDAEDEAFEAHRIRLRHTYLDAVRSLARLRVNRGEDEEAILVLRKALTIEPEALDLCETLIRLLAQGGRIVEARQQYRNCVVALHDGLDMAPPASLSVLEKLLFAH